MATSAVAYFALAVLLPSIEFQNPVFKAFQGGLPRLAPVLALILLVPAPISAFNSWRKRELVDTQESVATIRDLAWREFEELVAESYRRQGYQVLENHRGGADGGVDIRLKKDSALHLIQCKQWKSRKVGVGVVRELYGVMTAENAYSASVVSSGMFTQEAKNFASGKNVDLVDGPQLEAMIRQVQAARQPVTDPKPTVGPSSSACPRCGSDLVRRRAAKGKNSGIEFWGCSTFPKCRYTRNI